MFLSSKASRARQKEADTARKNRAELISAYTRGQISRRDLFRWGLITAAGAWAVKNGLSPFAPSIYGAVPTGLPSSPLPPLADFTQPMPRFEVLAPKPVTSLSPFPTEGANTTLLNDLTKFGLTGFGPIEGRPPGPDWSHQRWNEFFPQVAYEVTQEGAKVNPNPVKLGNGMTVTGLRPRFHPKLPDQSPEAVWTFNGTFPPKLILSRYGEPVLFRHHNRLPADHTRNRGFGMNELTTHNHNGHNPAESDGYAGAFFYPGQFYDYHWPHILAGHDSINRFGLDPAAGGPLDSGGIKLIPGDWRETMSTHWFHDHRVDFTAQNVYKGNAAMMNIYSAVDRGNETLRDGINLCLPSGDGSLTGRSWGNLDYDINLMIADKAWGADGQLAFDPFSFDGFLGDRMTVNMVYKPYLNVEARKYRFRILNAGVSRYFKLCLSDNSPMALIGNDGNLMERPVTLRKLDQQGIAERYDIVIDFSRYRAGQKLWMVNLLEHADGKGPQREVTLAQALTSASSDPCVGRFLEFRVVSSLRPDQSQVPAQLIPLPEMTTISRERTFEFGRVGGTDSAPWTIRTDGGDGLGMDINRISAAPGRNTAEIWHLVNGGAGWDHPIHIHFEEGRILSRTPGPVPAWEVGARKDVFRLLPGGSVTVFMQFREFAGMFMEHCHNTMHEDHAMLLRWEVHRGLVPMRTPICRPEGVSFIDPEVLPGA